VREISNLVRTSIPKSVQLRLDLKAPDQLPLLAGDASQLQQVVMNLVINGAEAIPAGEIGTVLVRTGVQDVDEAYIQSTVLPADLTPGQYVVLEVNDTGIGMDAHTMDRIFDPFFTTKFTGRGLGLAAVIGIVRGHKGALKIYSTPGQGTTFKVLFPVTSQPASEELAPSTASSHPLRLTGLILVVDDEEIVRKTAKAALERHGFAVVLASNGAEALTLYRQQGEKIAAVLLDLTMPGISGEETLRHLKSIQPDVKVILSSGYNQTEIINRFVGKGLAGFIQKPYSATALIQTIERVILESYPKS
jgi:CheY-like chemotaxis protein